MHLVGFIEVYDRAALLVRCYRSERGREPTGEDAPYLLDPRAQSLRPREKKAQAPAAAAIAAPGAAATTQQKGKQ